MTMLDDVLSLGGTLTSSVDTETGEYRASPERKNEYSRSASEAEGGLSTCHNSPQVTIYSGASFLKVSRPSIKTGSVEKDETEESQKPKRGKISEFTKKSRLRLMRELSKVRRDCLPVLVTLTYPGEYSDDPKTWKRHLDNFIKRMGRKFPGVAGVWKLEPQKRGAPHYHMLVWGASYVDLLIWVPKAWYEVVKSGDIRHLHAGTRVERVKSQQGVMFYASKYLGKEVPAEWGNSGRWWGIFSRENLPYGEIVSMEVSPEKAQDFIRYMRRFAHLRSRAYKSLTITCNPDFWLNKLL